MLDSPRDNQVVLAGAVSFLLYWLVFACCYAGWLDIQNVSALMRGGFNFVGALDKTSEMFGPDTGNLLITAKFISIAVAIPTCLISASILINSSWTWSDMEEKVTGPIITTWGTWKPLSRRFFLWCALIIYAWAIVGPVTLCTDPHMRKLCNPTVNAIEVYACFIVLSMMPYCLCSCFVMPKRRAEG